MAKAFSSAFLFFQVLPDHISQPLQNVPGRLDAVARREGLGIANARLLGGAPPGIVAKKSDPWNS